MKTKELMILFFWLIPIIGIGQNELMTIRGTVKEDKTFKPIYKVEIRVLAGNTYYTNNLGDFRIQARLGDEIIISHDSFNTIYHTIESGERIDVKVRDILGTSNIEKQKKRKRLSAAYGLHLAEAKNSLKKDATTSIDHVTKALETIEDDDTFGDEKKAELYETLADIYDYWKQPDLAESNYLTSLSNKYSTDVKVKLGNAQLRSGNYKASLQTFVQLENSRLSTLQRIKVHEGLGDSYKGQNDYKKAINSYNVALSIAQKKKYDDTIIELNSKLSEVLQVQGNLDKAEEYLDNSVELAGRKDKKTSARQMVKAADFYNKTNSYEKEIQSRKKALKDIDEFDEAEDNRKLKDTITAKEIIEDDKAITSQVQNYKIANAFVAQEAYDEAIPYLKESIKTATSKNDLVVQKDATRKLGEVYREKGELKKASEAFEEYEVIIDKLYDQKAQEISQAARFSRELAQKANRIATLEKDRELNESRYKLAFASQELAKEQSQKQRIFIYSLMGLTLLLLLAAYLMYRNMKQQRYANNLLALKSLRSQMNPHFIFNALNSVNTFIATSDERAANKYLTDFSLLMRAVLENSEEDFIPLEKEIELLKLYVQLEHFRFQDKFDYEIEVDPEIDISSFTIPPMLLQPYIENAVWHGLRYKDEKGLLSIHLSKTTKDCLEVVITDDGIGREKSKALKTANQKKQNSKGMSNIRKRIEILNEMYKDKVDVFISDLDTSHGTQVRLILKKE